MYLFCMGGEGYAYIGCAYNESLLYMRVTNYGVGY